ncbi:cobyrinate a,c-diamide synthase [Candidatus Binatus sp.]|uniref:cobyrinate a,c-diamide synthase n=1 Tax=Candidatus Binatus sp. TaxID=2811406 RepID=UPI003F9A58D8
MRPSGKIPRVVIAATASGAGKTTATVALIGAMRARGLKVAAFKCGPDYLDPTYHERAAGVRSHNLDGWMMGRDAVIATFTRASAGADLAVIEGMMGLFDSATPTGDEGSSAQIAKWLGAPVILVTDASGVARTIAAVAAGFARFDPAVAVAGMICNRVGSRGHLDLLRAARPEIPIVGGFPASTDLAFPERHLGLLMADESSVPQRLIDGWSRLAADWLDLDAIVEIARSAPALEAVRASSASEIVSAARPQCRIGIAYDPAFHFYYEDNLNRLRALGARLVNFSPIGDRELPECDGLYFGGGYPEVFARELSSNASMLAAIAGFAARGGVIYAECGGLMYLADAIRTLDGAVWPMAAIVPGVAVMSARLQAIGYVEVETNADSILGPAQTRFRGHQFRYSTLEGGRSGDRFDAIYNVAPRWGRAPFAEGYRIGNVLASYVHAHWASNPAVAEALVGSCIRSRASRQPAA